MPDVKPEHWIRLTCEMLEVISGKSNAGLTLSELKSYLTHYPESDIELAYENLRYNCLLVEHSSNKLIIKRVNE